MLAAAGLVAAVDQHGRDKPYGFTPQPLAEVEGWIESISALWDKRLVRLKQMLESERPR